MAPHRRSKDSSVPRSECTRTHVRLRMHTHTNAHIHMRLRQLVPVHTMLGFVPTMQVPARARQAGHATELRVCCAPAILTLRAKRNREAVSLALVTEMFAGISEKDKTNAAFQIFCVGKIKTNTIVFNFLVVKRSGICMILMNPL